MPLYLVVFYVGKIKKSFLLIINYFVEQNQKTEENLFEIS